MASSLSLPITLLPLTYLTYLSLTPPNPPPKVIHPGDRLTRFAQPRLLKERAHLFTLLSLYQAVLTYTFPSPPSQLCPNASNLNARLFTWNIYTVACYISITLGTAIRLMAYKQLGANFTFQLAAPTALRTTGLYKWMQHPSYTGQVLVLGANAALYLRWDGGQGCWIPKAGMEILRGWGGVVYGLLAIMAAWGVSIRVRDEELMLRSKFGKEWEEWHCRTVRFVPGVI